MEYQTVCTYLLVLLLEVLPSLLALHPLLLHLHPLDVGLILLPIERYHLKFTKSKMFNEV